ncbi:MAG: DNA-binding transcriptional regulator [Verrucomicrobiales bacterium]|nr:DNA-binding transcriptional regulator [Verrucomicrobiales bacterium]
MPRIPQVALLVETSLGSGRDILQGIARYVREHRPWSLHHEPRALEDEPPRWLAAWRGDGIIARVQTPALARAIAATGAPVVDVLGVVPDSAFPLVHVDDAAIGEMAADHLLERGLRHFAYLGLSGENWSAARQAAFARALHRHGYEVHTRDEPRHEKDDTSWEAHLRSLTAWVRTLPPPCGVMVCSDQRGSLLLEACRRAGRQVPDEIAVLGVDNDEPLCNVCNPPLSSIWPGHAQVGYQAAALLGRLMAGEHPPATPILIPPRGLVTRHSSDVTAVEDAAVAHALRLIRRHAVERLRIDELAAAVGISRSVLQRRFRHVVGRTLNEELIRQRLKTAQYLLRETSLPLIDIAERAGFQHQEYLGAIFKQHLGLTPAAWRRQAREGTA